MTLTGTANSPPSSDAAGAPLVVSIVINNFNYRRFLQQSIDSALAQTYPHVEVVVADDASTDGSPDLIRTYGDRITAVLQPHNGGQGAAMNAGFAASRGELVIFLDADDYLYPDAAQAVADAYQSDAALIQYRMHLVGEAGDVIDLYPSADIQFDHGDVRRKLLDTGRFQGTVTSGQAFLRKALASVFPIPVETFRISADGYLLSAVPFYGDVLALENVLGAYRLHGKNLWSGGTGAASFRRSLLHDKARLREVLSRARAHGLVTPRQPELRDYQHLSMRLGSLALEPAQHPFPEDSRLLLGLRGVWATPRAALSPQARLLTGCWFLLIGITPVAGWARVLVRWRYEPASRPQRLRRLVRWLRGS